MTGQAAILNFFFGEAGESNEPDGKSFNPFSSHRTYLYPGPGDVSTASPESWMKCAINLQMNN